MSGLDEAAKSAWCRANGVHLNDLVAWRQSATQALAAPEEARASPTQTKRDTHGHLFATRVALERLRNQRWVSDGRPFGQTWQLRHLPIDKIKERCLKD